MASVFLDIREDPIRPVLDAGIFVEPRDKSPASEYDRQAAFVGFIRLHARLCRVVAIRNGAHIASNKGRGKAKAEGLHTGWPDVGVCWGPTAWIEFKDKDGTPDARQIEVINWLARVGSPVAICRTAEAAIAWLRSLGAPVPEVRA